MLFLKTWRFLALLATALTTGLSFCHLLELPSKMLYDAALYVTLQQTLYTTFQTVGVFVEVGAIASTALLCFLVRQRRSALPLTLFGSLCLVLSLITWLLFIAPTNGEMAHWLVDAVPANWMQWQSQWEYAHACRFFMHLVGLASLLCSVLAETPSDRTATTLAAPITPLPTEIKWENSRRS